MRWLIGAAMAAGVGAPGAMAQTPPPSATVVPLPAQHNPPPLEAMLRPPRTGPAAVEPPYHAPPAPAPRAAQAVAQAALATCARQGLQIGVAVLNAEGTLVLAQASTEAHPGVLYTAAQKAWAALSFDMPTTQLQARLRADEALRGRVQPNMAVYPGAVPWQRDGQTVGAIGASGATAQQDEACLLAAMARVKAR